MQALISRRLNHYSDSKNDNPRRDDDGATATTIGGTNQHHHNIVSTIAKMGRGVEVGQYATTTRTYTSKEVDSFGNLIRDFNPLHSSSSSISSRGWWGVEPKNSDDKVEELFELQRSALETAGLIRFEKDGSDTTNTTTVAKALVHGIFVSGIFSSIFASIAPGCVYVNQSLDFCAPVYVEDTVVGCIHIERIRDWTRRKGGVVVECQTRVYKLIAASNAINNNNSPYQQQSPSAAELVIQGRANVWLPIGHINEE